MKIPCTNLTLISGNTKVATDLNKDLCFNVPALLSVEN
jgi:hypothetical protein